MTVGSELAGWGEWGARGGGQGATGAPDFARPDRGDVDDHWSHAVGEPCSKCGVELTARDFVRRRSDGTWVHEGCPPAIPAEDVDSSSPADEPAEDH